jgi:hypothetical protein
LGRPVTAAILTLVFYCVVTPLALRARLLRRDRLRLTLEPRRGSYWQERPAGRSAQHVYQPY